MSLLHLLKEYLNFENENKGNKSSNFIMKGNYNTPNPKVKIIKVFYKNMKSFNGSFLNDENYISPGKAKRFSLRMGINEINKGITLSYAETLDKS